jgi:hypothetical protein
LLFAEVVCSVSQPSKRAAHEPVVAALCVIVNERAIAAQAFKQLKRDTLIRSTLSNLVDPENWCEIAGAGRESLKQGTLDDLDSPLGFVAPAPTRYTNVRTTP